MSSDQQPSTAPSEFVGSVPQSYQSRLVPLLFEDYADDLTRRIAATNPAAVLEIAAGTGVVTQRLLAALPSSTKLTVTDFSQPMLDVAAQRLATATNATFQQADATALPFNDNAFDAVACQFGVMFFPDEPLAYREARRVLNPAGLFAFSVWDDFPRNPLSMLVHNALAALAPDNPPTFFNIPFRDLEATAIIRNLQDAGFAEVTVSALPKPCRATSATAAVEALMNSSPLGAQVQERGLTDSGFTASVKAIADTYANGDTQSPFTVPMQAIVFEATAP